MQACRTPVLGGHVHVCADCGKTHFAYHSCNHKACPQCGRNATAQWVAREQAKLIGAPYFMVTLIQSPPPAPSPLRGSLSAVCLAAAAAARLTVPEELRGLFFGQDAKQAFDLLFAAASAALRNKLASPKWLGAQASGFTMVLHTWSQKMLFHPHLHSIDSVASSGSFTLPLRFRAAPSSQSVSRLPPPLGCSRRWTRCAGKLCRSEEHQLPAASSRVIKSVSRRLQRADGYPRLAV